MPNPDHLTALQAICDRHQRFLVISHVRPDGDAYGSSLGLGLLLRDMGKDVVITNADGLSPLFTFLPGSSTLTTTAPEAPEADRAIIAVDCADQRRLGPAFEKWERKPDVNIDHHVSNPGYGTLNIIDAKSPATAQVLYDLITALKWPLSADVASNLYVGIMTDTGSFRYRQTTVETFEVAAKLVAAGADPTHLAEKCFQSFRAQRLLLIREMLNTLRFAHNDQIASVYLGSEAYARSGAIPDETEGLIEFLQAVDTVEVAFLLEAMEGGMTRGSLRSRGKVDVQQICSQFGGGGHRLAAGLRTKLDPVSLEKQLVELIGKQLPN
jgi:bifunctional oligoribonuclease and PAP phosphatase NrnA